MDKNTPTQAFRITEDEGEALLPSPPLVYLTPA